MKSMRPPENHFVGLYCGLLPASLQARLTHHVNLVGYLGKHPFQVTIFGDVKIDVGSLLTAARSALHNDSSATIDHEDKALHVCRKDGTLKVVLREATGEHEIALPTLMLLSPVQEERLEESRGVIDHLGPTEDISKDFAAAGPLTDQQMSDIMYRCDHGLAGRLQNLTKALHERRVGIDDVVPTDLEYFEKLVGPLPSDRGAGEYLSQVIVGYRKELIRRDKTRGLEISLLGALHQSLSPAPWVSELSDDDLWEAMQRCGAICTPIALLAAFEISLHRLHDDRYATFAENALLALCAKELTFSRGNDAYALFPTIAQLVENRLYQLDGGAILPSYWIRMASYIQAGFLVSFLSDRSVDISEMEKWAFSRMNRQGMASKFLAMRREPMFHASESSAKCLRSEVLARIRIVRSLLPPDNNFSHWSILEDALAEEETTGSAIYGMMPGPTEGDALPKNRPEANLPARVREDLLAALANQEVIQKSVPWATMLSQICSLDDEIRIIICQAVENEASKSPHDLKVILGILEHAAAICAAHRDRVSAERLSKVLVGLASEVSSENELSLSFTVLLLLAACWEEEKSHAIWLEEQLCAVAWRLPSEMALAYANLLQDIEPTARLGLQFHLRALAIAGSAFGTPPRRDNQILGQAATTPAAIPGAPPQEPLPTRKD